MNRVISHNLWKEIKRLAKNANRKRAAVAYVTSDEVLKFGEGDILIVDASDSAIASGQTDAGVLRSAFNRGAEIYSCPGLHAKVMLLGGYAVIGSANISKSSMDSLIEAALISESPGIVSMAGGFISKLQEKSDPIDDGFINRICSIKVKSKTYLKRPSKKRKISIKNSQYRTWIVGGLTDVSEKLQQKESKRIEEGEREAKQLLRYPDSEVDWIRFTGKSKFRKEAKENDQVIQIWKGSSKDKRRTVYRHMPIILRKDEPNCTRFYIEDSQDSEETAITWSQFFKLTKKVGIKRKIGPNSDRIISSEDSEALFFLWPK